jgi:hypothetical protein
LFKIVIIIIIIIIISSACRESVWGSGDTAQLNLKTLVTFSIKSAAGPIERGVGAMRRRCSFLPLPGIEIRLPGRLVIITSILSRLLVMVLIIARAITVIMKVIILEITITIMIMV